MMHVAQLAGSQLHRAVRGERAMTTNFTTWRRKYFFGGGGRVSWFCGSEGQGYRLRETQSKSAVGSRSYSIVSASFHFPNHHISCWDKKDRASLYIYMYTTVVWTRSTQNCSNLRSEKGKDREGTNASVSCHYCRTLAKFRIRIFKCHLLVDLWGKSNQTEIHLTAEGVVLPFSAHQPIATMGVFEKKLKTAVIFIGFVVHVSLWITKDNSRRKLSPMCMRSVTPCFFFQGASQTILAATLVDLEEIYRTTVQKISTVLTYRWMILFYLTCLVARVC